MKSSKDHDYYATIGIWPHIPKEVAPKSWLQNFTDDEQQVAEAILGATLYLNNRLTRSLLVSGIHNVSTMIPVRGSRDLSWQEYLKNVIVTFPSGATPRPDDSANLIAQWVKNDTPISHDQIMSCDDAKKALDDEPRDVLFLDDFAGTGEQITKTWSKADPQGRSFDNLAMRGALTSAFYTPVLATNAAIKRAKVESSGKLRVAPAQKLGNRHRLLDPNTTILPASIDPSLAQKVVIEASSRAGIPADRHLGYGGLGLTIAFEHGVPNNSLALLWWDKNGWRPLFRRRES